jgi:hypothetical protein
MRKLLPLAIIAAGAMLGSSATQAFCITPSDPSLFANDVAFTGCGVNMSGVTLCDMNGVQGRWTTHGAVSIDGPLRILSWTRNTLDDTEEYTCRINSDTGLNEGAVHQFSGIAGAAKGYLTFTCGTSSVCD